MAFKAEEQEEMDYSVMGLALENSFMYCCVAHK